MHTEVVHCVVPWAARTQSSRGARRSSMARLPGPPGTTMHVGVGQVVEGGVDRDGEHAGVGADGARPLGHERDLGAGQAG